VLATVKGDVHDIGKNCGHYLVQQRLQGGHLGIKQPAGTIIEAAKEHNADRLGFGAAGEIDAGDEVCDQTCN